MNVTTERIWSRQELWQEACSRAGYFVPANTLRDWIVKVCKLRYKDEYTDNEAAWVLEEWIPFQRNYPKRSTAKVKDFHKYMEQKLRCQS